jgi:hypothetical protein
VTAEIAHVSPASIEQADPAHAAEMVTAALIESRSWLAVAMQGTDPTPIAEIRAWAKTVEEATKQKNLGREIELEAAEMVRRADRGIGVAIRKGQDAGEIAKRGDIGGAPSPGQRGSLPGTRRSGTDHLVSPKSFFGNSDEAVDTYAITDGVTDEQFEAAVTEAKAEGNLSRANVVRKVKKQTGPTTRDQRADLIADLAQQGFSSRQIAPKAGVSDVWVRQIARDEGIEIPADKVIGKTRRIDSNRIVESIVTDLEATKASIDLIDYDDLDQGQAGQWANSLDESFKVLNRFRKQIKELTQ